jgi:hypothetical protein
VFQVASQFNLLEMTGPEVSPEDGVTRYQHDRTQGPACAIAAGAATIYRNYFAPVGGGYGQTAKRQFDGLADLGEASGELLNKPVETLWSMQNGYALCTRSELDAITEHLGKLQPEQIDILRCKLCIGVHMPTSKTAKVSQATAYAAWCRWCAKKASDMNAQDTKWLDWNGTANRWRAVDIERAFFALGR